LPPRDLHVLSGLGAKRGGKPTIYDAILEFNVDRKNVVVDHVVRLLGGEAFLQKTKEQIASGGVPADVAAKLTVCLLSRESDGITGKFISGPWDPGEDRVFQDRLRKEPDFAALRRIDARQFVGTKA
jgi:hypothetical protein